MHTATIKPKPQKSNNQIPPTQFAWKSIFKFLRYDTLKVYIQGGSAVYKNQEPIRVTNHKDPISEETKKILSNTKVWRMEYDFYNFAKKIFDQESHFNIFTLLNYFLSCRRQHLALEFFQCD